MMDERITQSHQWLSIRKRLPTIAVLIAVSLVLLVLVTFVLDGSTRLSRAELDLTRVSVNFGPFEELMPLRANAAPAETVYLDLTIDGRVEEVLQEEGTRVETGTLLVRLSNTKLQMDLISREAEVSEQLNNIQNTRILMDQDELNLKRDLLESQKAVAEAHDRLERLETIYDTGAVSEEVFNTARREYELSLDLQATLKERIRNTRRLRQAQLTQLEDSYDRLKAGLEAARHIAEALNVRAPADGRLSSLSADVGEYLDVGTRLGQIDNESSYKLVAEVDEFYLGRISIGTSGAATIGSSTYLVNVSRIVPEVQSGTFQVELELAALPKRKLTRGQSVYVELQLGIDQLVYQIPMVGGLRAASIADVYVLQSDGIAVLKQIEIGRTSPDSIEIVDGVQDGEELLVPRTQGEQLPKRITISQLN